MKTSLRTRLTLAAALLVPLGALVCAQPAAAQDRDFHGDRDHGHSAQVDRRAPQVSDLTPSSGARVSERGLTRISARFQDDRSGVDPRTVTLRVDGRDVTARARVDGNDIRYADNLRPGGHVAQVVLRDRAGNVARRTWSFTVRNDVRGGDRVG